MGSIRRNIAEYLSRCNYYETMGERVREKIAENPYFQIETVFERMDKFKKGYLVPDDFSEFMLDNHIYPNQIQLYLVFRDFDKERAGVVTLQQVASELLPKENPQKYKKAISKKYYPSRPRLQMDLEYIIAKYFEHKMKEIKELSMLRVDMFKKQVYTVEEAFAFIDHQKQGVISKCEEIDQFMRSNGKVMRKDELVRIFRVLCFDKESFVTYETFSEHLDPLGKGYYIGYSQRVAEKHQLQQDYLRKRIQLKNEQARVSKEHLMSVNEITYLERSNHRLTGLIEEQAVERRLFEEELIAYRARRHIL